MDNWIGPVAGIAVAVIAASASWLTFTIAKNAARTRREDTLNRRFFRLINYAQRLRGRLEAHNEDPEPWPDNLFDSEEAK